MEMKLQDYEEDKMLMIEDKSSISELNKLSEEKQRTMILKFAAKEGCEVYFGMIKKNQKDGRNFHILTSCGVLLQREEFIEWMTAKKQVLWSIVDKTGKRIRGDFGTVIYEFNKAI